MPTELLVLTLAALLQMAQLTLMAVFANRDLGPRTTMGPRDPAPGEPPLVNRMGPVAGRLHRAATNHFEGLILFTIAVLAVTLGDRSGPATQVAAWVYLGARLLYVPAYVIGRGPWRSLIWGVGFLATAFLLLWSLL